MLMEDSINNVSGADKKKMSKMNATSFNKLKQNFKKYLAGEGNDNTYEKQLLKYRENPIDSEQEKDSDEEDEKEPEVKTVVPEA
jgi:translation initiation factor 3 subunit C